LDTNKQTPRVDRQAKLIYRFLLKISKGKKKIETIKISIKLKLKKFGEKKEMREKYTLEEKMGWRPEKFEKILEFRAENSPVGFYSSPSRSQ